MTKAKSIVKHNLRTLLRYTDIDAFKDTESILFNKLCDKSELIRGVFRYKQSDRIHGIRQYFEDPLLYGIYWNDEQKCSERFTITLVPTADERSWDYQNSKLSKIGIYQDRSYGIGLLKVIQMDNAGISRNKKMVFECTYLPGFLEDNNTIKYACISEYAHSGSLDVNWIRKNKGIETRGTAQMYRNHNYQFTKESRELYERNLEKLYLINIDDTN